MSLTSVAPPFETKTKLLLKFNSVLGTQMQSKQNFRSTEFSGHNMKLEAEEQCSYTVVIC